MLHWLSGDVIANGIRIHYDRSGGDKAPILLAHGITESGRSLPQLAEALQAEFEVIAYGA